MTNPEEGRENMHKLRAIAAVVTAFLLVPAAASAQYPEPKDPGKGPAARGKGRTLTVCKKGCRYRKIQRAVKAATGKDTIKVRRGRYREGVNIVGRRYDGLKLIGDSRRPGRVVLDGKGLRGAAAQNAVFVNSADGVVVRGFHARRYKANCFFHANVVGYVLDRLVAERCGAYGIFAFNSKGGRMTNSEAYYNNDAGFYVGQTPPQRGKKRRTLVRNVEAWGNVLGFSGTNMRYVTITKSRWYNNGSGIVPNALDTEKYPPPQENVISNNDVFWNNLNFYYGAPFEIPADSSAGFAFPIGVGILLFGSQDTVVEGNRISGHYLSGLGAVPALQLAGHDDPDIAEAANLRNNTVRGNDFGPRGDLNGRDLVYDGSGTGNCFEGNTLRSPNVPGDNGTFAACPGPARNTPNPGALAEALSWVTDGSKDDPVTFEKHWIKHPHPARKGVKPLERFPG
ncbi:MAG TPA: right-handed parallel beta-helix repeat-containing protein [Thermoleophilaceae bacterium]|nr:right-handed parallel beta-helix repeat-containing protein [Thermoleophilaceae bacterium]